jgi:hypothetical protein
MRNLVATLACAGVVLAAPLDSFLPPTPGFATGGELGAAFAVTGVDECATACLAAPGGACISFSVEGAGAFQTCGIRGECYAPNATSCPAVLTFGCYEGVFSAVQFASYGTPTTVGSGCSAWAKNASCDAPSSAAVVAAACVGRSSCSVEVGVATFGADPCPGVYKFLAASLVGNCSAPPPDALRCQLSGYARDYTINAVANATAAQYFQRLAPRNDAPAVQAVPWLLSAPARNVTLRAGVLRTAFDNNILYLTQHYTVDDMLFQFRKRAGNPNPPGACHGWEQVRESSLPPTHPPTLLTLQNLPQQLPGRLDRGLHRGPLPYGRRRDAAL